MERRVGRSTTQANKPMERKVGRSERPVDKFVDPMYSRNSGNAPIPPSRSVPSAPEKTRPGTAKWEDTRTAKKAADSMSAKVLKSFGLK
jgi:hypothetical protein